VNLILHYDKKEREGQLTSNFRNYKYSNISSSNQLDVACNVVHEFRNVATACMLQITGMVGSVEYAIAEDRLDEDGELWEAQDEDPAADRESSMPFMVTPYAGVCVCAA
jgi:hypothetical protein